MEAEGGYLFLCVVMYSSKRFMAKTITINTSCGLNICITSSLIGRSERPAPSMVRKGATATGRQCRSRLFPGADASCLASGQQSKVLRCRVFPGLHRCNTFIIQKIPAPVKPFSRKKGGQGWEYVIMKRIGFPERRPSLLCTVSVPFLNFYLSLPGIRSFP